VEQDQRATGLEEGHGQGVLTGLVSVRCLATLRTGAQGHLHRPWAAARRLATATAFAAACACEALTGIGSKELVSAGDGGHAAGDGCDGGAALEIDAGSLDPDLPCSEQTENLYCNDFDDSTDTRQNWQYGPTIMPTTAAGSMQFDLMHYRSAPQSLQVVAPAPMTSAQVGQMVTQSLATSAQLAFDLRLDFCDWEHLSQVALVQINLSGAPVQINYIVGPKKVAQILPYVNDAEAPSTTLSQVPPLRAWSRIVIAYDAAAGVSVYEDGLPIGADASLGQGVPGQPQFILGSVFMNAFDSSTTETLVAEFDNVVFRGQ
jgi:hypothetical protein